MHFMLIAVLMENYFSVITNIEHEASYLIIPQVTQSKQFALLCNVDVFLNKHYQVHQRYLSFASENL